MTGKMRENLTLFVDDNDGKVYSCPVDSNGLLLVGAAKVVFTLSKEEKEALQAARLESEQHTFGTDPGIMTE